MSKKTEKKNPQSGVIDTMVIPLYGRKLCSELYPELFKDEEAERLVALTRQKKTRSGERVFCFLLCCVSVWSFTEPR